MIRSSEVMYYSSSPNGVSSNGNSEKGNSSSGNSSSNGFNRDLYIYEIPQTERNTLCAYIDELNVWSELAINQMSYQPADLQRIRRVISMGNSPTDELLNMWGELNHTVTELFVLLHRMKLYKGLEILKDFVEHKYSILIPKSLPQLSYLLHKSTLSDNNKSATDNHKSKKILNYQSSSGISNSNNATSSEHNINNSDIDSCCSLESNVHKQRSANEYASTIPEIKYQELTEATQNWDDKFILGKGGFGTVFRGYWKHTDVAIKQIHYHGPDGKDCAKVQVQQSLNELKYLNSCRHDNILPLYGYSMNGEKPCLVYQLMTGGSLEERLKSKEKKPLSFQQRINVARGTARGLNYLHTFREKPLIHGDIKPANVLLDQCNQPKIGDFGLAREGPNALNSAVKVTQVFGTRPYLPREFLNLKKLSTKVDTYSFGVVLLETFTGLRVHDKQRPKQLLTEHIISFCANADNQIENLIDKRILILPDQEQFCKQLILLGLDCIADSPDERPEMVQVLRTIGF